MVLSVLDGSTLRTPHNIYVLDGSTVRRVRQIRALDGSTLRHPFTKTDYFDFSGTANTLNPATAEVYTYEITQGTNSGTQTVYTGGTTTSVSSSTNSYTWSFFAGNPGSTPYGGDSWTRAFSNMGQARYLTGLNYFPSHTSTSMSYQIWIRAYYANAFNYGNVGVYDSSANIAGGTNNWNTYTHFVGPTTWSTKYHEPHGGPSVSGGTSGASPQHALRSGSSANWGWYGSNYSFNNTSSAGVGVKVYASSFIGYGGGTYGTSYIYCYMYGTTQTTSNTVSSSSSTVNLGATFSVSGAGWSVGSTSFGTNNSTSQQAGVIKNAINSALPSGWSVSKSGSIVTVTAPASSGNVNDMSVSISNGSGINQGTNPSPGQTFTVRPASNVAGSGSTVQGVGQTGNLTSATVTSGGNSTSVNLSNGASTDTAGSEIASAMNGLADTTATYDSGTNRMTVVAPGDTSVSLSNPNSLSVSKVSL
ncbi:hypothetical protein [uncultured Mediterranean phage uvMED]|nr:hypothetical protein [uncultured Mediterranean phage uvMED]